jgi:glycosyltransferase involved in cell wall biosynthesis
MPKFSIVLPVYSETSPKQEGAAGHIHYRGNRAQRAIRSVINQQYPDWELIIVDDGCIDGVTPDILDKFAESDKRIKVIHQVNQNRAISRNNGMEAATGEWICWLDSDDEYSTHYLRELNAAIEDFPEYKIFNFGSILHWEDHHTSLRSVFVPSIEGDGHEYFRSGHIGTGSFIFRRDLWASDAKYRIPDEVNAYQFAAASKFDMKFTPEHPDWPHIEDPAGAFTDGVYRHGLSLGNPWGDDFLQFFLLTRDNHSKPLDVLLYVQYPRAHEERYEHYGEIYEAN